MVGSTTSFVSLLICSFARSCRSFVRSFARPLVHLVRNVVRLMVCSFYDFVCFIRSSVRLFGRRGHNVGRG